MYSWFDDLVIWWCAHAALMPPLREVWWVIYIWSFGQKNRSAILNLPAEGRLDLESGLLQRSCDVMWCDDVLMQRWCLPWGRSGGWLHLIIWSEKYKCHSESACGRQAWYKIWLIAKELWSDDVPMQRWCLPWGRSGGWLTFDHLVKKKENHHSVIDSESGLV